MKASRTALAILAGLWLSACGHIPNMVADVKIGMDRETAIRTIVGHPTFYYLKEAPTEYILFRTVSSFTAMYREYSHDVEFMRLENGRVVDKGYVDKAEEERIRKMRPNFVLREWQGNGEVPADHTDDGRQ